jgi:hypothetical protein
MKLEFVQTDGDYINLNIYITKKILKKQRVGFIIFYSVASLLLFFGFGVFFLGTNEPIFLLFLVGFIIPGYLAFRFIFKFDEIVRDRVLSVLKGKDISTYSGPTVLELTEKGLKKKNPFRYEHVSWKGILRVEETDGYIFLFDSDLSALIIPKRAFESRKDLNAFRSEVNRYMNIAKA